MTKPKAVIVSFLAGLLALLTMAKATTPPGVGVYGGLYQSEQETADFMAHCAGHGVDLLTPSIGGTYALWVTEHRTYSPTYAPLLAQGYDALESYVRNAHALGIEVHPSITIFNSNELFGGHPEWATKDAAGNSHSSGLAFSYPDARAAKIPLFLDLLCNYDIDGLFLDYCRYPEPIYGFDQPIIDECVNTHGFDPRNYSDGSPQYEIFCDIRAQSVTDFVGELKQAALQCRPDIVFGGFGGSYPDPDPEGEARDYGRDYAAWAQQGYTEYVYLGTYYEPISRKRENVQLVRQAIGPDAFLYACLCPYDSGAGTHLTTDEEFLQATREQLMGGADGLWVYRQDALESLDLWDGLAESSYKYWKIRNVPTDNLVEYDAALASGDPTTVVPAWALSGQAMVDQGDSLLQDGTGNQTGEYTSPVARSGLMTYANPADYGYGLEFKVYPFEDASLSNRSDGNLGLRWSDDTFEYGLSIDKDSDDGGAGLTGSLFCGTQEDMVLMAEYDASEVANLRPDQMVQPWDVTGSGSNPAFVYDAGDYLAMNYADNDGSQSANNGDYGGWASPYMPGFTMKRGQTDYKIEVKVKPVGDIASTGYSYEYANTSISWADDVYTYRLCIDKDSDDGGPGTLGRVARGKYPMVTTISNIDWSVPHTIKIEYIADSDVFYFYLDGVFKSGLDGVNLESDPTNSSYQNRIFFGDSTEGGYHPDYNMQWYYIRIYGSSSAAIDRIDWTQPQNVFVAYHSDDSYFYFYLNGKPYEYISSAQMTIGGSNSGTQDRIAFGDRTSGGLDLAASWYHVRVHDTNVCGNVEYPYPLGDINSDCAINELDIGKLAENWLSTAGAGSSPVAEYDASAVSGMRPDELSPAWVARGLASDPSVCSDAGDYLLMDTEANDSGQPINGGDTADWTSPDSQTVGMVNGTSEYSIMVKVQPLGDIKSSGYRYEPQNLHVGWSDNLNHYILAFDKDSDDSGSGIVGDISRNIYPMVDLIGGVDWSIPHTLTVVYKGSEDMFYLYLDDVFENSVSSSDLRMGPTQTDCQNKVRFGDSTTAGWHPDYSAKWYEVALYDYAVVNEPCGSPGRPYPTGDLNEDCAVDLEDLAILALQWQNQTI